MKLTIFNETDFEPPESDLESLFERLTQGEKADSWPSQVNLVFTDDERMQELNQQYRSKDKTTDVLSFNIDDPDEPDGVLGEIYISLAVAKDQAQEYQVSLSDEIRRLFAHGLLHLLGYNHEESEQAKKMFATEEKYLKRSEGSE